MLTSRGRSLALGDRAVRGERARCRRRRAPRTRDGGRAHAGSARTARRRRWRRRGRRGGRAPARRRPGPAGLVSAAPWWRRLTLPSAWKVCTNGMSRSRQRRGRREPGHPEVRVHDVGRLGAPGRARARRPARACAARARPSGSARAGPASTWRTIDAGVQRHELGQVGVVAAGEHGDLVARGGERPAQLADVHVLPAGVGAAGGGEGARVLGDHSDAHGSAPSRSCVDVLDVPLDAAGTGRRATARSSTASQSARKRGTPKRSSAASRATCPAAVAAARSSTSVRRPSRSRSGSVESTPASGGTDLDRLGGRERDDRHAQQHRLDQREPERGPARGVDVGARGGRARRACGAGAGRRRRGRGRTPQVLGQAVDADAEHVERRGLGQPGQQVGAGDPAAAHGLVDADARRWRARRSSARRGRARRARRRWCGVLPASHISALKWVTCTSSRSSRSANGCRVVAACPRGVLCSR